MNPAGASFDRAGCSSSAIGGGAAGGAAGVRAIAEGAGAIGLALFAFARGAAVAATTRTPWRPSGKSIRSTLRDCVAAPATPTSVPSCG